jgi:hypothetical protein
MTSSVPALVRNPLISLTSPVSSSVPRRFAGRLQHIDIVTSPVLAGPLSRNPHTPCSPRGAAWGRPWGSARKEVPRGRKHCGTEIRVLIQPESKPMAPIVEGDPSRTGGLDQSPIPQKAKVLPPRSTGT